MLTVNCDCQKSPNPTCCSDPNLMCPECAQEALSDLLVENIHEDDDDDVGEFQRIEPRHPDIYVPPRRAQQQPVAEDPPLLLPVYNFSGSREEQTAPQDEGDGYLLPPVYNFARK